MYPAKGETHRPNAIVCMVVLNISSHQSSWVATPSLFMKEITAYISIVSRDIIIISNNKYYILFAADLK